MNGWQSSSSAGDNGCSALGDMSVGQEVEIILEDDRVSRREVMRNPDCLRYAD